MLHMIHIYRTFEILLKIIRLTYFDDNLVSQATISALNYKTLAI